jgi:glycosyltransferase involved in cell wall biosynthesis
MNMNERMTMKLPTAQVAIITRTKDRPILLKRAIESVINQEHTDWLHVIVNDVGEKDSVDHLVASYKDAYNDRVIVIHRESSTGMESASNTGINASDSTFLVIHDDDDAWHPQFLSKTVGHMEAGFPVNNVGGVLCHSTSVHERIENDRVVEVQRAPYNHGVKEVTLWKLCVGNFFPPISFIFTREAFHKLGGAFCEELPVLGDWEFNLRFLMEYELVVLQEPLAYYHHRVEDKNPQSIYANSIIGGLNKHEFYGTYLRNELLRKDLREGKVGLGFLVNQAGALGKLEAANSRMKRVWHGILRILKPIRWVCRKWIGIRSK